MRNSSDFNKLKAKAESKSLDRFIQEQVYSKLDEEIYPAVIYLNLLTFFDKKLKTMNLGSH
jgi:hypothetical protein